VVSAVSVRLAREGGTDIDHCELIGLAPLRALREAEAHGITIDAFDPSKILETRLAQAGLGDL